MPHFTLPVSASGPMLDAFVAVSSPRLAALQAAKVSVPSPVRVRMLVDTGASCTCLDPTVLAALQLTPTGQASMTTPSTGGKPHITDQYDVGLLIPSGSTAQPFLITETISVVAADLLAGQGFHGLLGRDILRRCLLSYNGAINLFTLAY